jgi:SpoVK/Ycf46/Vps4 family AAA+-type ATPase
VLLDEADVFLAKRHASEIHRNELVSIFLRELEYFRGVLFLTTNLPRSIDEAFRSRVSMRLVFGELKRSAREAIWRKFLERLPAQDTRALRSDGGGGDDRPIDEEDLRQLSLWQLNGREIQNAVKMARTWCDYKRYMLTCARVENTIEATTVTATKGADIDNALYE